MNVIERLRELGNRWFELCKRLKAKEDSLIFRKIIEDYSNPRRKYHTLEHIYHCLKEFDEVRSLAENSDALEIAIWFHDAIYQPGSNDNEEKSEELASRYLELMALPDKFKRQVKRLILATKHNYIPEDTDSRLIVDIDLSSLGLPNEEFKKRTEKIRAEYEDYSNEEFRQGSYDFAKSLLSRGGIYLTPQFKTKYERQARKNLETLIVKALNN